MAEHDLMSEERRVQCSPAALLAWLHGELKRPTRRQMSVRYGWMLLAYWHRPLPEGIAALNNAIVKRWSIAGLDYIKKEAWKGAEQVALAIATEAKQ